MTLTDRQIRAAKPKEKPYKLADGGGLYLQVAVSGSKLWRMKYRYGGKEKLLSFGPYPHRTLQSARRARDEARQHVVEGRDPGEIKKQQAEETNRQTEHSFAKLASLYLDKQHKEGRAASTISKNEWLLAMATNDFGKTPVSEIKASLILSTLKRVEARGTLETANRLRSVIGTVLRYGIALGWLEADPTPGLKGAISRPPRNHRAAITDPDQFGALLRTIDHFEGQRTTQIALQLLALLYPRPGELRLAHWAEFDLEARVWQIPAERMKMRRPHRVPLQTDAVALLQELKMLSGNYQFILPSIRSWKRPMSDNTINAALRRMGYSKDEMTAHGFRATFSTLANESGLWHPDAIERALAHVEGNDVRRAYDRSEHWEERVRMAEWWATEIQKLKRLQS
ncbi:integrase arm-type DNA-binding domain-containing protein [Parvularcula sp. IMCC14364]|uniref:tyrosine-type recombinase/integrase n=1 Tax=Parvularcula sp. IMCC14364 TaxID=3067902 RepID=UPI0027418A99|nr:integrase arm-type DNA-binding domain-containing protein [Parvularcula sp. IMCC14364]